MAPSNPIRVSVVGASGYTGSETVRLLSLHPYVELAHATSERLAGRRLSESCPWLATDIVLEPLSSEVLDVDFVFLCQRNRFAMEAAPGMLKRTRVIDLSADFRLKDPAAYEAWYGGRHTAPELLDQAIYSIPELCRQSHSQARLLANPGCYPTATLLALQPLVEAGWVVGTPVIDAKSGVSGAGRTKTEVDFMFTELDGGFRAYAATGHRHTPEIEQQLGGLTVRFTPHLVPMTRGICSTIHVPVREGLTDRSIRDLWLARYAGRPCVRVQEHGFPSTKAVLGSNACVLACAMDDRTGFAVLVSVIDNMVKGAAGQAIQNMNLMAELPEATGLPLDGVWP